MDMKEIAAKVAPYMSGTVVHPGDDRVDPFPLAAPPMFKVAQMPPEVAKDMADQAGFPHADIPLIYCEGWLSLVETVCNVTLIDNDELAELRAELAHLRVVADPREHETKEPKGKCGGSAGRMFIRDLHTPHPIFPCESIKHDCKKR